MDCRGGGRRLPVVSRNKSQQIEDDLIQKNAAALIYHAGLLKNEIMQLTVADVLQNGRIVPEIPPVAGPYPRGYKNIGIELSGEALALLDSHIEYLQRNALMTSSNDPLFPNTSTGARYTDTELTKLFSLKTIYGDYREHRESGIRKFAWDLFSKGYDEQWILDETHRFARYTNLKKTERVMRKGISQDPGEYDSLYRETCALGERLVYAINTWPEKRTKAVLEELEKHLDSLFPRHRTLALKAINERIVKARVSECIVYADETLSIEDTSIRI